MATTEFQSTTNLLNRLLDKINLESKATSTAKLAVIVAVLALILSCLISISAWSDAKEARAIVEVELRATRSEVQDLSEQIDVLDIRYTNLLAYLKAHDIYPKEKDN